MAEIDQGNDEHQSSPFGSRYLHDKVLMVLFQRTVHE